jgi:hypothetical protein
MPFHVDFNWTSQAILEMHPIFSEPPPRLEPNGLGPQHVSDLGNGRWHRSSSYYFNCGVNHDLHKAPPEGDLGLLSQEDGRHLQEWFEQEYAGERPNVLKNGEKWNFTLVKNGNAFNFHVLVR